MYPIASVRDNETTPLLRRPRQGSSKACWNVKYTFAFLAFLGIMIEYCQRVCLSVAIVSMVGSTNSSNSTESKSFCPDPSLAEDDETEESMENLGSMQEQGRLDWDKATQGLTLSAFFWGYACTNLLGGRASEYIGGKMVFGNGILLSSLLSLICPISAESYVELFIACRILMGLAQGVTFPSVNLLLATWSLPEERSKLSTIVYSGFQIGTVVGMMVTGWLCSFRKDDNGWPLPFYFFGALGIIWSIAWYFCVYERPEDHPNITPEELWRLNENANSVKSAIVVPVPWKKLLTSVIFWAIMSSSIGNDYGFYTLLTELPTYLHDVQHFDITANGLLSSLPYFMMWIFSIAWAALVNYLTHRKKISIVNVRRISMVIALYGPMTGLIIMCFVNCNATAAVIVLCVFGMLNGSVNSGSLCSHQDVAPNLAGSLLGMGNTLGAISGIVAPAVTGLIVGETGTLWEWRSVFLISVGIYFLFGTFYIAFVSSDVQPWNEPMDKTGESTTQDVPDNACRSTLADSF